MDFNDYGLLGSRVHFRLKGTTPDKRVPRTNLTETAGRLNSNCSFARWAWGGNRLAKMFSAARCHDFSRTVTIGLLKRNPDCLTA